MSKPVGPQIYTLPVSTLPEITINLLSGDELVQGRGIHLVHLRAIVSPLGLKERGDLRRPDFLDDISSNGMIYQHAGCFVGAILGNRKSQNDMEGGIRDNSMATLTLPRFYENPSGCRIYLSPGDKIYAKDMDTEVVDFQRVNHSMGGLDRVKFPIKFVEYLIDSDGVQYNMGCEFNLTSKGNIQWVEGKGPGLDKDTGKGKVFSIRYRYDAHWYIYSLPHELRTMQQTIGDVRKVERAPYQALIQREYCYFNQNNSETTVPNVTRGQEDRHNDKPMLIEGDPIPKVRLDPNDFE